MLSENFIETSVAARSSGIAMSWGRVVRHDETIIDEIHYLCGYIRNFYLAMSGLMLATILGFWFFGVFGDEWDFLAGRHLTDAIVGPSNNVLNANAAVRRGNIEIGIDAYNLLNLKYADDAEYYVSNWSMKPGTALASPATHLSQAPPLTMLGTLALYF